MNLEHRISALEQTRRNNRPYLPCLAIVIRKEQNGEPTEDQAAQIAIAQKEGRDVYQYCVI